MGEASETYHQPSDCLRILFARMTLWRIGNKKTDCPLPLALPIKGAERRRFACDYWMARRARITEWPRQWFLF